MGALLAVPTCMITTRKQSRAARSQAAFLATVSELTHLPKDGAESASVSANSANAAATLATSPGSMPIVIWRPGRISP